MKDALDVLEAVVERKQLLNTISGEHKFTGTISGLTSITKRLIRENTKIEKSVRQNIITHKAMERHNKLVDTLNMVNNKFAKAVMDAHNEVFVYLKIMYISQHQSSTSGKSFSDLIHSNTDMIPHYVKPHLLAFNRFRNLMAHNSPFLVIETIKNDTLEDLLYAIQEIENHVFNFVEDNKAILGIIAEQAKSDIVDTFGIKMK